MQSYRETLQARPLRPVIKHHTLTAERHVLVDLLELFLDAAGNARLLFHRLACRLALGRLDDCLIEVCGPFERVQLGVRGSWEGLGPGTWDVDYSLRII